MQKKYKIDQRGQNIGFWQAGRDCLRGSFSYGGYTTRKGYFFGGLIISLPGIVLEIFSSILVMSSVSSMLTNPEASGASFTTGMTLSMLGMVCTFLAIIPGLPSTVRRLRDAGLNNQGIIIFLASSLILALLPVINIVVFIVNIYVTFQPSGRFLTDEKNHLFFSNREEEQQDHWTPQQPFNQVVETVPDENAGDSARQIQETDVTKSSQEGYKTSNPITQEIQNDLDEMVMGVSSYVSPSDTATRVSAPSSPNGIVEEMRNPDGTPYSSVYSQKSTNKFMVIGVIAAVILCIAGLSILVTNKQNTTQHSSILPVHKTIDVSTYDMVLYSDGESGNGTAEVEITSIPYYEGYDEEIEQLLWNPTVSISKDSGLSNGDVVTVRIELDQDELERLGLDATGIYEQDVTISKLEEPYVASSTAVTQEDWPLSKQNELAQYMIQFGNEMNQPNYQRISITKPVVWSGRELDENFKILDGYEYWYDNYTKVHRYIFVVNATGEPVVLYSKDTGDPEFYIVSQTQNEMLPIAFREIYY
ncbi:TPA: DUF805 domain-containing protein [Streptococcus suis]|nr:DUF805 domain-containing protein [Streptococcus suis]